MVVQASTRDRLLDAGMARFAEKGFRATTVGEIEAAVGLQPRRGALYRHFPSKQALLEAGIQRHLDAVAEMGASVWAVRDVPVRELAVLLGTWLLAELDGEETMVRIMENDGARLPALRERVREHVNEAGYRATADLVRLWAGDGDGGDGDGLDVDALAVLLIGSLINVRRSTWTFGRAPRDVDDERIVRSWADLCERLAGAGRLTRPPDP